MKSSIGKYCFNCIALIFLFSGTYLHAQMDTPEAISLIKEKGLVLRLNCNSAKLDTLTSLIKRAGLSDKSINKIKQERDKSKKEFDEKNAYIIQSFLRDYKFSKIYFVPDSLFKEFVSGRRENIFVDESLELFTDASFPQHFVFGYFNYDMKLSSIKFRHSEYKPVIADYKMIKGDFPKEVKGNGGFFGALKGFFSFGINWKKNLNNTLKKLGEDLAQVN